MILEVRRGSLERTSLLLSEVVADPGNGPFLVAGTVLVLVGAIFFAVDPKIYERGFLLLMPPSKRAVVDDALLDTASTLRRSPIAKKAGSRCAERMAQALAITSGPMPAGSPSDTASGAGRASAPSIAVSARVAIDHR